MRRREGEREKERDIRDQGCNRGCVSECVKARSEFFKVSDGRLSDRYYRQVLQT